MCTAAAKQKQTTIKYKIAVGVVEAGAALLTDAPVEPPLNPANVVTRYVYVPPDMWPGLSEHGWVAKVIKCSLQRPPSCKLKLHDGSYDFSLESVLALKPVS